MKWVWKCGNQKKKKSPPLSGFSLTDSNDAQDSRRRKGRGPSFIPLFHFHPLTNIQTFICSFACEMIILYFQLQRLCLPDCYSMRFITLLMMQSLFVYLMVWFWAFITAIWHGKPVDLNSNQLSPNKRTN